MISWLPSSVCSFYILIFLSEPHNKRNRISAIKSFIKFLFFIVVIRRARFCFVSVRNRPFNLWGGYGFLFRSEIVFRTTQEVEYLFFLSRKARNIFQNSTLGYMTKTLNQILFSSTKIRIFFQQHWKSEYFFSKLIGPTLKYVNNLTRKGYGLANLVQSMRQVYFAPNIDNLLIQLVAGTDPGGRGRTPRAPP